ncbi:MAG: hypothetical protein AAB267_01615 [Candidatus Desantisbacteria bacterium]
MTRQKIIINDDKIITRNDLFKAKEEFHKSQAKLHFEEKIRILVKLQEIASHIKGDPKAIIWKI